MRRFEPPGWLLAALVALMPAWAALGSGLASTIDGALHLQRTLSVAYLLQAAPGWPRWAPHFLQGWGYPIHHYYPPLVPLAAAILTRAGARPETAHVALIALAWSAATVGTYALARTALPPSAAVLAAGVAAFSGVRLFEVQVQGNLPQLIALALLPWALRATLDAVRDPGTRSSARLAVSVALIALCHHLTLVLVLPLLGAVAAVEIAGTPAARRRPWRPALSVGGGLALAAILAAVYLLPAVIDAPRVQLAKAGKGMFDATSQLVPLLELVRPLGRVDRTALAWPFTHGWGPAAAVLALLGAAALLASAQVDVAAARARVLRLTGLGLACVVAVLPWSAPLWRDAPLIGLVQFPWRLLGVAEPLLALPVGAALLWLPPHRRSAGLAGGLAMLAIGALPWLPPIRLAQPLDDPTARSAIAQERRPNAAHGTTSSLEYLPRGARPNLDERPAPAALDAYAAGRWWVDVDRSALPAGLAANVEPLGPRGSVVAFGPGPAALVRLRQLWFPGWRAWVDGQAVRMRAADVDGAIVVDLPASAGPRRLAVAFVGDAVARLAGALSGFAWLIVALWAALSAVRRGRVKAAGSARARTGGAVAAATPPTAVPTAAPSDSPTDPTSDLAPGAARALAIGLIVAAALGAMVLPRTPWLAPRSAAAQPRGMGRSLHAILADGGGPAMELLGADVPLAAVAGRSFDVRLYWRALRPLNRRYRPFVQLITKGTRRVLANHTATDPGGQPTRGWPLDRFAVDVHRLVPSGDAPAVTARLIGGLFDDDTGARLRTPDGADTVALGDIRLRAARPAPPDRADGARTVFRAGARLGDAIRLERASAERLETADGPALRLTLYWRAVGSPGADLTVFRHVLDDQGRGIAQADGPPALGDAPTADWRAGDRVVDDVTVPLAPGAARPARVAVGLYAAGSGRRQPAFGPQGRWPDDAIIFDLDVVVPPTPAR